MAIKFNKEEEKFVNTLNRIAASKRENNMVRDISLLKKEHRTEEDIHQYLKKVLTTLEAAKMNLSNDEDNRIGRSNDPQITFIEGQMDAIEKCITYIEDPVKTRVIALTGNPDLKEHMDQVYDALRAYGHIPVVPMCTFYNTNLAEEIRSEQQRNTISAADFLLVVTKEGEDMDSIVYRDIRYTESLGKDVVFLDVTPHGGVCSYNSYSEFPYPGIPNITYFDQETGTSYIWDTGKADYSTYVL